MNSKDIDVWAASEIAGLQDCCRLQDRGDERAQSRIKRLQGLRAELRRADPCRFPPGSVQHTLALYEQRTAMKHALALGYEPPERALLEIGAHTLELGLGL
ncbi:hypothetical protein [Acidithiobacillus thiooxidans]|uniref:Uncharacterized protein n=1 Tax=Acidithiobacillus thiooxidans ATCC 19377 TaxID=637390 RepID=A0A5P9XRH2_ACITH|nr:hypothetical protein [Acidithiobacillus thiooxidans]QFX96677.1 hypothetical protein GCD22_02487 [Acidithiobacillus thiooxidans ATCC 19377]